jgi:hypothetical protein
VRGETIDQVAAFSAASGKWHTQHLREPIKDEITPAIGPGSVLYQAGNDFYAFSAQTALWGVLHLEGKEPAKASISPLDIEVLHGNQLYVFSLTSGKWSEGVATDLRPFRQVPVGELAK